MVEWVLVGKDGKPIKKEKGAARWPTQFYYRKWQGWQVAWRCEHCGTRHWEAGAKFCRQCGARRWKQQTPAIRQHPKAAKCPELLEKDLAAVEKECDAESDCSVQLVEAEDDNEERNLLIEALTRMGEKEMAATLKARQPQANAGVSVARKEYNAAVDFSTACKAKVEAAEAAVAKATDALTEARKVLAAREKDSRMADQLRKEKYLKLTQDEAPTLLTRQQVPPAAPARGLLEKLQAALEELAASQTIGGHLVTEEAKTVLGGATQLIRGWRETVVVVPTESSEAPAPGATPTPPSSATPATVARAVAERASARVDGRERSRERPRERPGRRTRRYESVDSDNDERM